MLLGIISVTCARTALMLPPFRRFLRLQERILAAVPAASASVGSASTL